MDEQIGDDLIILDENQEEDIAQEDGPVLQQNNAGQGNNRLQVAAQAITPHVLATLLQDRELQATFAKAFFLDDMDNRIGVLENQLSDARQENERLAAEIDMLNGELLPGGNFYEIGHDQLAQSNWSGYRGSALSRVRPQAEERQDSPPRNIRPVRNGRLERKSKPTSKQNRRQVAGEEVMELWGDV